MQCADVILAICIKNGIKGDTTVEEMKENEVVTIEGLRIGYQDSNGWHDGPNTVGGVSLSLAYTNRRPTPIKYIVFCLVPYNNVGDIVPCRVRGRAEARARDTGPLQQGKVNRGYGITFGITAASHL